MSNINMNMNNVARPLRKATTAKGENPEVMDNFPNMGTIPIKRAEANAEANP
jgi:hypothetical protein